MLGCFEIHSSPFIKFKTQSSEAYSFANCWFLFEGAKTPNCMTDYLCAIKNNYILCSKQHIDSTSSTEIIKTIHSLTIALCMV